MQDDYIHGKRPHHTWPERKQQRGGGGVPPGHHYSIKKSDHATQDLFNPILNVIKPLSSRQPRRNCKHDIGVLGVATQSQPLLFLAFLVADVGCTGNQPQLSHKSSLSCFIDGTVFLEKNASESHTWGVLSKLAASAPAHRACLAHATGATDLQFN